MPIFIVLCLALALIVQINSPIQTLLVSDSVFYAGLAIGILTIIGSFLNKISEEISYDIFSSSILFAWFAYWKPLFVIDSPIFFFFPVYFALMTAFVSLFFVGQRHKIDKDSLQRMQTFVESGVIPSWLIMLCVMVTLYFENRFIQFPVMMTLLMFRYALSSCLKPK
jgi:hypothetical protein